MKRGIVFLCLGIVFAFATEESLSSPTSPSSSISSPVCTALDNVLYINFIDIRDDLILARDAYTEALASIKNPKSNNNEKDSDGDGRASCAALGMNPSSYSSSGDLSKNNSSNITSDNSNDDQFPAPKGYGNLLEELNLALTRAVAVAKLKLERRRRPSRQRFDEDEAPTAASDLPATGIAVSSFNGVQSVGNSQEEQSQISNKEKKKEEERGEEDALLESITAPSTDLAEFDVRLTEAIRIFKQTSVLDDYTYNVTIIGDGKGEGGDRKGEGDAVNNNGDGHGSNNYSKRVPVSSQCSRALRAYAQQHLNKWRSFLSSFGMAITTTPVERCEELTVGKGFGDLPIFKEAMWEREYNDDDDEKPFAAVTLEAAKQKADSSDTNRSQGGRKGVHFRNREQKDAPQPFTVAARYPHSRSPNDYYAFNKDLSPLTDVATKCEELFSHCE